MKVVFHDKIHDLFNFVLRRTILIQFSNKFSKICITLLFNTGVCQYNKRFGKENKNEHKDSYY
ncbi:hypothetical protein EI28_02005 [Methanoculleus sp. MH98A]|nr:hypothetical protein EI28_02005 [Methanoculleus sp. MH98A]